MSYMHKRAFHLLFPECSSLESNAIGPESSIRKFHVFQFCVPLQMWWHSIDNGYRITCFDVKERFVIVSMSEYLNIFRSIHIGMSYKVFCDSWLPFILTLDPTNGSLAPYFDVFRQDRIGLSISKTKDYRLTGSLKVYVWRKWLRLIIA